MHLGVFAPFVVGYVTPALTLQAARAAEDLGFHSLWVPEHVLLFDEYESRYPYAEDGRKVDASRQPGGVRQGSVR